MDHAIGMQVCVFLLIFHPDDSLFFLSVFRVECTNFFFRIVLDVVATHTHGFFFIPSQQTAGKSRLGEAVLKRS